MRSCNALRTPPKMEGKALKQFYYDYVREGQNKMVSFMGFLQEDAV